MLIVAAPPGPYFTGPPPEESHRITGAQNLSDGLCFPPGPPGPGVCKIWHCRGLTSAPECSELTLLVRILAGAQEAPTPSHGGLSGDL